MKGLGFLLKPVSKTLRHFLVPGGEKESASFWSGKCWADKAKSAKELGYCSEEGIYTTGKTVCLLSAHPAFFLKLCDALLLQVNRTIELAYDLQTDKTQVIP